MCGHSEAMYQRCKANKAIEDAETERIIRTLKRLEKNWPKRLWLFSANGTLHLMEKLHDGRRKIDDQASIWSTSAIENDGGDW